jgi:hypothetical protein
MATSQRTDFVGVFSTDSQFPISKELISMKFDPCLDESKLLAGQLACQDISISEPNRSFELSIFGVDVGQVVMQVVE